MEDSPQINDIQDENNVSAYTSPDRPCVPHAFLGAMVAVGFLLVVLLASLRRDDVANAQQVITIAGLGLIGGIAVVMLSLALGPAIKTYLFAAISLVLLILTSVLFSKLTISVGLTVLCGDGVLGFAFILLLLSLALVYARRRNETNATIRIALGFVSTVALMIYIVQLLVLLAEGGRANMVIAQVFSSGDPVLMIFSSLIIAGLVGVAGFALATAASAGNVRALSNIGFGTAWGVLGVIAIFAFVMFLFPGQSNTANWGERVLALTTTLVGGLTPLAALGLLHVMSTGEVALAVITFFSNQKVRAAAEVSGKPRTAEQKQRQALPLTPEAEPSHAEPVPPSETVEEQLRKLKKWHEEGLIGEEEYQAKRQSLLERM